MLLCVCGRTTGQQQCWMWAGEEERLNDDKGMKTPSTSENWKICILKRLELFPTWKSQNPFEFDSLFTALVYFWATYWFYSFYWILKFSLQIFLKCSHEQIVEVFHQTNFATHSYDFQFNQCAANKQFDSSIIEISYCRNRNERESGSWSWANNWIIWKTSYKRIITYKTLQDSGSRIDTFSNFPLASSLFKTFHPQNPQSHDCNSKIPCFSLPSLSLAYTGPMFMPCRGVVLVVPWILSLNFMLFVSQLKTRPHQIFGVFSLSTQLICLLNCNYHREKIVNEVEMLSTMLCDGMKRDSSSREGGKFNGTEIFLNSFTFSIWAPCQREF